MENNNKQKILNAAIILFQDKGYYGTGLNEILRKSDCPKGSLYYYFPNGKEQLALESIEMTKNFVDGMIRRNLEKIDDPAESMKKFVCEMAENVYIDNDDLSSFQSNRKISINLIALETSKTNDNIRKACEEAYSTFEKAYFDKLVENGFDDDKAKEVSKTIESLIEGAILMSTVKKDDTYILNVADIIYYLIKKSS